MIRWLMVGLLLFTESACDSAAAAGKNAVSNGDNAVGAGPGAGPGDKPPPAPGGLKTTAPTADEEDVYRLTCYTCVNVSNNKVCNEWAIDTPCPAGQGRDFCQSLHILDSRGESVLVSKSCVSQTECHPRSVGCVPYDTQKVCISCCDTSYCNVDSPTNATNATFSRKRRPRPKDDSAHGKDASAAPAPTSPAKARAAALLGLLAFTAISVFLDRAYH